MRLRISLPIVFSTLCFLGFFPASYGLESLAEMCASGKIRLVPELTVDEESMEGEYFFQSVIDMESDKGGCLYIADYRANNIKKFDPSGRFLKVIGRKGQGPGEFV